MTRVIHTGDTHVGYRQYHAPERRADFLAAFRQVVDDAISENVDAVVHAGDLFHDRRPDLADILGTLSVLRDLRTADIPFLAIVGNHERTRNHQWLDLFESLDLAVRLGDEPETVGDTAFYGLDHVPRSKRAALDYEFAAHDRHQAALVSHGLFQPFAHGNWDAEEVLAEASVEFDAMLLGDNHDPGKVDLDGTWVTYCGSTERASAAERDPRGYNIVEFGASGSAVSITRRGLDTREFVFVDLELDESEGVERVRERIREEDVEDAVVIVTLDGDGEQVTPASVEEFAHERGALVARVNDHRELDDEGGELSVSFADPDDAVRERVRELGLSEAARDIDETVRASKTADSNVRTEVESRVRSLVEDDLDSFAAGEAADGSSDGTDPADEDGTGSSTARQAEPADESADAGPDAVESGDGSAADGQVSMEDYL